MIKHTPLDSVSVWSHAWFIVHRFKSLHNCERLT